MKYFIKSFSLLLFTALSGPLFAQSVSVSPSRLYFEGDLGDYKSQLIRVTNNGQQTETFLVSFNSFMSEGNKGKTKLVDAENNTHSCAEWLSASPAFFELQAGQTQDVQVLLQVPNTQEANSVRWAVASVKVTKENTGLNEQGSDVVGMQILQTFQFLIHVFQTPPGITHKEAQVDNFKMKSMPGDSLQVMTMDVHNTGPTILNCAPYLDLVNLNTGEMQRIKNKGFTVLPNGIRQIRFILPSELETGKYSVLGVIDYGSDSDLAGAELTVDIP